MTAISDFCATIRSWLNYDEYSDALITSWVRMAEELVSENLRCKHMIAITELPVVDRKVSLPADWLALDFVRVKDGKSIQYRSRDQFYSVDGDSSSTNNGFYTLTGNFIIVGGEVTPGMKLDISYYQKIPPLDATDNWLMQYYSRIYLAATLSAASAFGIEDSRAVMWETSLATFIETVNNRDMAAKSSGSSLKMPRRKGFG